MSEDKEIVPRADMLMGSMRSMGYSFESAICEIFLNNKRLLLLTVYKIGTIAK